MDVTPTALETFKLNPIYFAFAFLCAGLGFALAMGALVVMKKRPGASLGLGMAAAALGALAMTAAARQPRSRQRRPQRRPWTAVPKAARNGVGHPPLQCAPQRAARGRSGLPVPRLRRRCTPRDDEG